MAVVASVERFAYKGVSSNLVTYLADVVGMSTSAAAKSVSTWSGVNFMLPLVSAFLADSYWDRYSTITASSLLYVLVSTLFFDDDEFSDWSFSSVVSQLSTLVGLQFHQSGIL